jgi:hypothetical protein
MIYYIYITETNSIGGCQSNQRGEYDDEGKDKDAIGAIGRDVKSLNSGANHPSSM